MTEKRFRYYEHKGADYILDNPNTELDFIEMLGDCLEAEEIVDLLNKLSDENEQLKKEIRNLRDFRRFITEKNVSNDKERKELQMQMLRLYNYFENYFEDEMSPNAFSEMWDNVKEDEKWENR